MEFLENKLDHLTPEQRREVEDFVDFLIQRAGGISVTIQTNPPPSPADPKPAPPPFIASEPAHPEEVPAAAGSPATVLPAEPASPPSSTEYEVSPVHEISGGDSDNLTRDYMDYGQFEQPAPAPSPADAAVKRVKAKISKRAEEEKPGNNLLDWID